MPQMVMGQLSYLLYAGYCIQYSWARRKTELAIQYASKVRTESPQTWVFWLCATTKEQFDEDLLAIADISPERSLTKHNVSQKDLVLDWLRKPTGEQWLMVIDDVNPSDDEV